MYKALLKIKKAILKVDDIKNSTDSTYLKTCQTTTERAELPELSCMQHCFIFSGLTAAYLMFSSLLFLLESGEFLQHFHSILYHCRRRYPSLC